jgi:ABC-type transport system involved in cytochrome c biogenesis ATPase subunit
MRIKKLSLQNIGPFIEADLDFTNDEDTASQVVLITGENGTGKSIILDAIRGMFGPNFARLERDRPQYHWFWRLTSKIPNLPLTNFVKTALSLVQRRCKTHQRRCKGQEQRPTGSWATGPLRRLLARIK